MAKLLDACGPPAVPCHGVWHPDGLKTVIDAAGRVIIPKALRDGLGLRPGLTVEVRTRDGALVIEPVSNAVVLVRRGRRVVAKPLARPPKLTQEGVRAVLEGSRR